MSKTLDKLDPLERELYRILKTFTIDNTKECFPSISEISKPFKRSRNTTKKYLGSLSSKGFIRIEERRTVSDLTKNSFNKSNKYTLLFEDESSS